MIVEVYFDNNEDLILMPFFSKWFTDNKIQPLIGESIFACQSKGFKEETRYSGSGKWEISDKFFEPEKDKIIIWCVDGTKRAVELDYELNK